MLDYNQMVNKEIQITQPAKSPKSNTRGVNFCGIGIQYAMPYSQKHTPPHCFFGKFAGWEILFIM